MNTSPESSPSNWLKEDPFPHLATRDLLHSVAQGVIGGSKMRETSVRLNNFDSRQERFIQSCVALTERAKIENPDQPLKMYYLFYWLLVSTVCKNHILVSEFGSVPPSPGSYEFQQRTLIDNQQTIDDPLMRETSARITGNDYQGFLNELYVHGRNLLESTVGPYSPLEEALEDFQKAHEDATSVLSKIQSREGVNHQ